MAGNGQSENEYRNIRERYELITAGVLGAAITLFLIYFIEMLIFDSSPNLITLLYVFIGITFGLLLGRYLLSITSSKP